MTTAIAALTAVGIWLLSRDSTLFPPTVVQLTQWLDDTDCESVNAEEAPLRGAFGELPLEGAYVRCEKLAGSIAFYRFPSHRALLGTVRRHPELQRNESICVHGDELIVDELLAANTTLEFCRRLGFAIHHASS